MIYLKRSVMTVSAVILTGLFNQVLASDLDPVEYDKYFPYYAELCAGSQYRDAVDGNGGPNGHGVLFLKGACRDKGGLFPKLQVCEDGPGVGISTYFAFKNVLWVASEGRNMFLRGNLKPGSPLTKKQVDEVIQEAQKQNILQNVEMHDWIMDGHKPEKNKWNQLYSEVESKEHYMYRMSLGTDYGLALARNVYCVRIPMTRDMMKKSVDYLNGENDKAFYRKAGYEKGYIWDVARNNCMHTAYNALAAAGMWPMKEIERNKLGTVLSFVTDFSRGGNLAVPFDSMLRVAQAAMDPVFREPKSLLLRSESPTWHLQQVGTMLAEYDIYVPTGDKKDMYFNTDSPHALARDQAREFAYLKRKEIEAIISRRAFDREKALEQYHLEKHNKYAEIMSGLFNDDNKDYFKSAEMARIRYENALSGMNQSVRCDGLSGY